VLEAVFVLLEPSSPSRRIFISSHSLPPSGSPYRPFTNSIITDNGSQFTGRKFLEFCDKFHIRVDWAAVAHPQTNGQVERANDMVLQGLKPRIFDKLNKSG
jgi:transposase InsO family protein